MVSGNVKIEFWIKHAKGQDNKIDNWYNAFNR